MSKTKMRGWKEGILNCDLNSSGNTFLKKGSKVRYKRFQALPDKDGFFYSEYEFHYLDDNNSNLIRSVRLLIEGEPPTDYRKEYVEKLKKRQSIPGS